MSTPPIITIQFVPAGVEFVIGALRKLPHEQVDVLVQEIWTQYKQQMSALAEQALVEEPKEEEIERG